MIDPTLKQIPFEMASKSANLCLTLTIVFHPDVLRIGQQCQTNTSSIDVSRLSPLFGRGANDANPEPLADPFLSRTPISIKKNGSTWCVSNTDSPIQLATPQDSCLENLNLSQKMLEKGVPIILAGRIVLLVHLCPAIDGVELDDMGLIGVSQNLRHVRSLITKIAQLHAPVLIRGESGTGKELVAQAIHECGERRSKKLISISMAAISKELVNTELFGSVKGGFTGASNRSGIFREAHASSLFLDEIGEAPTEVQVALLRAIETGVIQPVGSHQSINVNVRFIAATDANLEALIDQESFRMPLLQRLSGLVVELAPLRERREDIGLILLSFLKQALKQTQQAEKLSRSDQSDFGYWAWFFAQCTELNWPGNVRQLKNMITQLSVALSGNKRVSTFDWQDFIRSIKKQHQLEQRHAFARQENTSSVCDSSDHERAMRTKRKPRDVSDEEVLRALKRNQWQIKLAADDLGISRPALYQKIDASSLVRRASNIPFSELHSSFADCSGDLNAMVNKLEVSKQALKRRLHEIGLAH